MFAQRSGHVGDRPAAWADAEMREGDRSVVDDGRGARVEIRIRMAPIVLEPLLERDVVHRNLTRDVAHGVARIAGPLTCYLVGVAVGRGADASQALASLTALVPAAEPDTAVGGKAGAAS
jgi:hypothetical protein